MKKFINAKTILLSVPNDFNLPENIEKNLEKIGFEVVSIRYKPTQRIKVPIKIELIHLYNKFIKRDRTLKRIYRTNKQKENENKHYLQQLSKIEKKIDYTLIIRPDRFSEEVIQKITEKAALSAAYQWDGIERFPFPKKIINYFDRFFLFDVDDLKNYPNCLPTTNFYFDFLAAPSEVKTDVFFVGSYINSRNSSIKSISKYLYDLGLNTDIHLVCFDRSIIEENDEPYLKFTDKFFNFEDNLLKAKQSKALLDFTNSVHNGLSFRTFESIGFRKKLITNNDLVMKYDFFHPDNIFVFKDDDYSGLKEFLEKPYVQLPESIYEKYSFSNWIKYILNISPHIPIELRK